MKSLTSVYVIVAPDLLRSQCCDSLFEQERARLGSSILCFCQENWARWSRITDLDSSKLCKASKEWDKPVGNSRMSRFSGMFGEQTVKSILSGNINCLSLNQRHGKSWLISTSKRGCNAHLPKSSQALWIWGLLLRYTSISWAVFHMYFFFLRNLYRWTRRCSPFYVSRLFCYFRCH